jgi:3-methylcrotonyl-CoA carboxylase alpha subunit
MGEAALRVARAAGYVSAGTVEFLFAGDAFYFLEVNTRIQVEHPVTEMVTGLDLVRLQIEIAAGHRLSLSQLDVALRGHAIEARLYAEDPARGFLPATGRLEVFVPPGGPGIRNDVGVEPGAEVSPHYDPILAKLIVHAETRPQAVSRLQAALEDYGVLGVTTNQSFLRWVAGTPAFVAGRMDTGFVDRAWPEALAEETLPSEALLLAVACDLSRSQRSSAELDNPWLRSGQWRLSAASRRYVYQWGNETVAADAAPRGPHAWDVGREGQAPDRIQVVAGEGGRLTVLRGEEVISGFAVESEGRIDISWRGTVYRLEPPAVWLGAAEQGARAGRESLVAPMPGTVVRVMARPGQAVSAHEPLVVMEAMKMEHVIEAPHAGVVGEVLFKEGDMVPAGSPLVRLEES